MSSQDLIERLSLSCFDPEETNPESEEIDYPDDPDEVEEPVDDWYAQDWYGQRWTEEHWYDDDSQDAEKSMIDRFETIANYLDEFECPICYETFKTGYATDCEHVFCTSCLENWMRDNSVCPYCRARIN